MFRYLTIFTLLLFFSCQQDSLTEDEIYSGYPGVDHRLWPYFERFEEEGAIRNSIVKLRDLNIEGIISEIEEVHVAGICQFRGYRPRLVTIDQRFWNNSNDLFKEFIVFHELGHCVLRRDHDESTNSNGVCLSIMRSGTGNCVDQYSLNTRQYYLDELFSKVGGI